MQLNLSNILKKGDTVAVALSGGADSMALLNYLLSVKEQYGINILALNVEHGIRGEQSVGDTLFVKDYCDKKGIKLLTYSVCAPQKAQDEKLSLEQAARMLRYECFFDAINNHKCDKVATAHHQADNTESVLLNLCRATGIKGLCGIEKNFENKIIRPFLSVKKEEILEYVSKNSIPFVTDQTNFSDDYSRNFIRLNVIPKLKEIFPELDNSISRTCQILTLENEYLDEVASDAVKALSDTEISIAIDLHPAIFSRAVIIALKKLGVKKDWEKQHVDSVLALRALENASKINLLGSITAIKEYETIILYKETKIAQEELSFSLGTHDFCGEKINIDLVNMPFDLKSGLFADLDKIPKNAIIRSKREGDTFTKFGGGTKSLGDYLTDKKIPVRKRASLPLLAKNNEVLAIFGVAISDKIKIDDNTNKIIEFR